MFFEISSIALLAEAKPNLAVTLTLLDDDGQTASTGENTAPLDIAVSSDERNLHTHNGNNDTIGAFRIKTGGCLAAMLSHIIAGLITCHPRPTDSQSVNRQ